MAVTAAIRAASPVAAWTGTRLGPHGVYTPSRRDLTIGTSIFYAPFAHFGTPTQAETPLLRLDLPLVAARLDAWLSSRVRRAGFTVASTVAS